MLTGGGNNTTGTLILTGKSTVTRNNTPLSEISAFSGKNKYDVIHFPETPLSGDLEYDPAE